MEIPMLGPEMPLAPQDALLDDIESPITTFF
jgi:hypothetical protein